MPRVTEASKSPIETARLARLGPAAGKASDGMKSGRSITASKEKMSHGSSVSAGGHQVGASESRVQAVAKALGTRGKNNSSQPSPRNSDTKPTGKNTGGTGTA